MTAAPHLPIVPADSAAEIVVLQRFVNSRIRSGSLSPSHNPHPAEVPPASEEKSVRTDGLTLMFRKRYFAELQGSRSGSSDAPRRALPVVEQAGAR